MGANALKITRANSSSVDCTVSGLADLVDYTATLEAKINLDDTSPVITKAGSISELIITFALTPTLTDVEPKMYHYDIVITDGTNEYTLVQDILEIEKSVSN